MVRVRARWMRASAHRRAMRAHAGRAPRMHNFALNSITVTLHCKSGRGPAVFANGAMRASLPARRPRPSARAPARRNRGQSQLLYYYYDVTTTTATMCATTTTTPTTCATIYYSYNKGNVCSPMNLPLL